MFKQILGTLTKVSMSGAQQPRCLMSVAGAMPTRAFMTAHKPMVNIPLLMRPSLMYFSNVTNHPAAAETPASHMHRTMSLEGNI